MIIVLRDEPAHYQTKGGVNHMEDIEGLYWSILSGITCMVMIPEWSTAKCVSASEVSRWTPILMALRAETK